MATKKPQKRIYTPKPDNEVPSTLSALSEFEGAPQQASGAPEAEDINSSTSSSEQLVTLNDFVSEFKPKALGEIENLTPLQDVFTQPGLVSPATTATIAPETLTPDAYTGMVARLEQINAYNAPAPTLARNRTSFKDDAVYKQVLCAVPKTLHKRVNQIAFETDGLWDARHIYAIMFDALDAALTEAGFSQDGRRA